MPDDYSVIAMFGFRIVQTAVGGTFCTRESVYEIRYSMAQHAVVLEAKVSNFNSFYEYVYFVTNKCRRAGIMQVLITT